MKTEMKPVWDFVTEYYPNYYSSDEIARESDLSQLVNATSIEDVQSECARELLATEYDGDLMHPDIANDYHALTSEIYEEAIEGYLKTIKEEPVKKEPKFVIETRTRGNRSGFIHEADLYEDGSFIESAKVQYYNRTWESYRYQTVMQMVVEKAIDARKAWITNTVKTDLGVSRVTVKAKAEITKRVEADQTTRDLTKYLATL